MQQEQKIPEASAPPSTTSRIVAWTLILLPVIFLVVATYSDWQHRPEGVEETDEAHFFTFPVLLARNFANSTFAAISFTPVFMGCWLFFARRLTPLNIALSLFAVLPLLLLFRLYFSFP